MDIEEIIKSKSYHELNDTEKILIQDYIESEKEFEEIKALYISSGQYFNDNKITASADLKASVFNELYPPLKKTKFLWLTNFFIPIEKAWYHSNALRLASILLIFSTIYFANNIKIKSPELAQEISIINEDQDQQLLDVEELKNDKSMVDTEVVESTADIKDNELEEASIEVIENEEVNISNESVFNYNIEKDLNETSLIEEDEKEYLKKTEAPMLPAVAQASSLDKAKSLNDVEIAQDDESFSSTSINLESQKISSNMSFKNRDSVTKETKETVSMSGLLELKSLFNELK